MVKQLGAARDGQVAEGHRRCLEALVDLRLVAGDRDRAAGYARQLRELAIQTGIPATITAADLAEAALGDVALGERLAAEFEAEGRLFAAAQAHFYVAAFVPEPDEHLSRAVELFTSMGAQLWTPRAASQAKLLGLAVSPGRRRPRSKAGAPKTLSQTEIQLVQLLRQGLTNRQISAVMHYSAKTIEVYVSRLYQKVGYHSRLELVLAAERGELSVLPPEDRAVSPAAPG
jgi:DNA-binding CsgD family transcriptional regulator